MRNSVLLAWAILASPLSASISLGHPYRTAGEEVHAAFEEVRQVLQTSSAVICRGRDELIFGTVVGADGYILTKASELEDRTGLSVIVDREVYVDPQWVAEDAAWDLALLKIDAQGLVPVRLEGVAEPAIGTWVVANGSTSRLRRRVQVGIVAAEARRVAAEDGTVLGVTLDADSENGLRIASIQAGTGAAEADLREGDELVSLDGKPLESRQQLLDGLKDRSIGEVVRLGRRRDGETLEVEVRLSDRATTFAEPEERRNRNDAMSGDYSPRRSGFPRVLQHDIMATRRFIGGPVLDLDGRCLGMNIARVSRCETYAIPAAELLAWLGQQLPGGL